MSPTSSCERIVANLVTTIYVSVPYAKDLAFQMLAREHEQLLACLCSQDFPGKSKWFSKVQTLYEQAVGTVQQPLACYQKPLTEVNSAPRDLTFQS